MVAIAVRSKSLNIWRWKEPIEKVLYTQSQDIFILSMYVRLAARFLLVFARRLRWNENRLSNVYHVNVVPDISAGSYVSFYSISRCDAGWSRHMRVHQVKLTLKIHQKSFVCHIGKKLCRKELELQSHLRDHGRSAQQNIPLLNIYIYTYNILNNSLSLN